jgi:ribonuclease-3
VRPAANALVERESEIESALGHRFREASLLEQALTHSSFCAAGEPGEGTSNNEKAEFLGDAVLGLIASEHLVAAFPDWSEGQLSKARASLVNAGSLCAAARRLRLGDFLRLGRGEEKSGGREKPALLADAYEAVLAAVYLDGGLDAAREFVRRTLLDPALESQTGMLAQTDFKSALQELLQRDGKANAEYRVTAETGPDHRKTFVVEVRIADEPLASGRGSSKKEAERAAAQAALIRLASGAGKE